MGTNNSKTKKTQPEHKDPIQDAIETTTNYVIKQMDSASIKSSAQWQSRMYGQYIIAGNEEQRCHPTEKYPPIERSFAIRRMEPSISNDFNCSVEQSNMKKISSTFKEKLSLESRKEFYEKCKKESPERIFIVVEQMENKFHDNPKNMFKNYVLQVNESQSTSFVSEQRKQALASCEYNDKYLILSCLKNEKLAEINSSIESENSYHCINYNLKLPLSLVLNFYVCHNGELQLEEPLYSLDGNTKLQDLYDKYQDEDGFVYLKYELSYI